MDSYQTGTNKKSNDKQSVTNASVTDSDNDIKEDTIPGLGHNIKKIGFGQKTKQ